MNLADVMLGVRIDRETIRLSDSLTVTCRIDGPGPLVIEPPMNWLAAESQVNWHIRPVGVATVQTLENGQERWEQRFTVEPFAVGAPLALRWNPIGVRSGRDRESKSYEWPEQSITVTTEITTISSNEVRPVTGMLSPDHVTSVRAVNWPLGLGACAIITILLAVLLKRRKKETIDRGLSPGERLRLALNETDPTRFIDRVAVCLPGIDAPAELIRQTDELRFRGSSIRMDETDAIRRSIRELTTALPASE